MVILQLGYNYMDLPGKHDVYLMLTLTALDARRLRVHGRLLGASRQMNSVTEYELQVTEQDP